MVRIAKSTRFVFVAVTVVVGAAAVQYALFSRTVSVVEEPRQPDAWSLLMPHLGTTWRGRLGEQVYSVRFNAQLHGRALVHGADQQTAYCVTVRTLFRDGTGLELLLREVGSSKVSCVWSGALANGNIRIDAIRSEAGRVRGPLVLEPDSGRRTENGLRTFECPAEHRPRDLWAISEVKLGYFQRKRLEELLAQSKDTEVHSRRVAIVAMSELPVPFVPVINRLTEMLRGDPSGENREAAAVALGVLAEKLPGSGAYPPALLLGDPEREFRQVADVLASVIKGEASYSLKLAALAAVRRLEHRASSIVDELEQFLLTLKESDRLRTALVRTVRDIRR